MNKVIQLFDERTEILHRVKCDVEEFDPSTLPSSIATSAAAWLKGVDVRTTLKPRTFFNHARRLREYGIDISEKRNIEQMPIKIKTIELTAAAAPDWYSMERTPLIQVAA